MNVRQVSYRDPAAPEQFVQSLRETGFAVLKDHPISLELIEQVFAEWADFFKSPAKHDFTFKPETQEGYFPFKTENAKNSTVKDLKEFYHYFDWSKIPPGLGAQSPGGPKTRLFFDRMNQLAVEMLGWIDDRSPQNIKSQFSMPLREMIQGSRETLLRPIHYPPLTGAEEDGAIRAAAHEDINLITLLPAASAPGLQVKDTQGRWHDVACDRGSIAINAGDMLQMASGGYYKSTTHQVVNPKGAEARQPRYSMPLFLHPRHDVKLAGQTTAGTYLAERLAEIGLKTKK